MKRLALLATLALAGCGDEGSCKQPPTGSYLVTLTPSGTNGCGLAAKETVVNNTRESDPDCTGMDVLSADMCSQEIDRTCPDATDADRTTRVVGTIHWNHEGTRASGTVSWQSIGVSGATLCASNLLVEYSKL
jgi:hypothetical protein